MSYTENSSSSSPSLVSLGEVPQVGQILETKCVSYLISSPPREHSLDDEMGFELITVPGNSKLLVVAVQGYWFKVIMVGANKTGWFEKHDTYAYSLLCQKP